MLFHSSLEISGNSDQNFSSYGVSPETFYSDDVVNRDPFDCCFVGLNFCASVASNQRDYADVYRHVINMDCFGQ